MLNNTFARNKYIYYQNAHYYKINFTQKVTLQFCNMHSLWSKKYNVLNCCVRPLNCLKNSAIFFVSFKCKLFFEKLHTIKFWVCHQKLHPVSCFDNFPYVSSITYIMVVMQLHLNIKTSYTRFCRKNLHVLSRCKHWYLEKGACNNLTSQRSIVII